MNDEKQVPEPMLDFPGDSFEAALDVEVGTKLRDYYKEGIRIAILRGPASFCAYFGIPIDHPLSGYSYEELPGLDCHGGLTYSSPGKANGFLPEGYWWYGIDYAHAGDVCFHDLEYNLSRSQPGREEHRWTVEEIESDILYAIWNIQALMNLAEKISMKAMKWRENATRDNI